MKCAGSLFYTTLQCVKFEAYTSVIYATSNAATVFSFLDKFPIQ